MLDEPTNHLDLPTIQWLEDYLRSYDGTVIVVSHDREFLDRMVSKIVEVSLQRITEYPGNYSKYLDSKSLRTEQHQREYENQQDFIRQQQRLIDRFKAKASKASMAQSRVKMLDRIDKIEAPEDDNREINIDFRVARNSGKVVCDLKDVSKSFPDIDIVKLANRQILRGDKIALIGANGKGKSTVLRMIAGTESFEGEIIKGHNVEQAFYAQHQLESLNMENEILEELRQYGGDRSDTELRTILGCFLFNGDEVFKKIKVLSGGEKARVALARTLLAEANFQLLDEPTNHLDIRSINILIQALQKYEGTFLAVSHDRFFISQIANKIWWIEDQELKEYPGTYAEYEYWKNKHDEEVANKLSNQSAQNKKQKQIKEEIAVKDKPKNNGNRLKELTKQFELLEQEVEHIKKTILEFELNFSQPEMASNPDKFKKLQTDYNHKKEELQLAEERYNIVFEELMSLQ
jgi:ATP-binding cassette subfamily F protein 3